MKKIIFFKIVAEEFFHSFFYSENTTEVNGASHPQRSVACSIRRGSHVANLVGKCTAGGMIVHARPGVV